MALYSKSCTEEWFFAVCRLNLFIRRGLINIFHFITSDNCRPSPIVPYSLCECPMKLKTTGTDWEAVYHPQLPYRGTSNSAVLLGVNALSDSLSRIYLQASPVYILHIISFNKSLSFIPPPLQFVTNFSSCPFRWRPHSSHLPMLRH